MGQLRTILLKTGLREAVLDTFYPLRMAKLRGWFYRFRLKQCGWATVIDPFVVINGGYGVSIGEYSALNSFVHIWGHGGVTIGNRVMIASHVSIVSVTHDHTADSMRFAKPISQPIFINDDVWIGAHVVILPGVTLGEGSVIGAGSVVREDVEPYAIVAGTPARLIRYRTINPVSELVPA